MKSAPNGVAGEQLRTASNEAESRINACQSGARWFDQEADEVRTGYGGPVWQRDMMAAVGQKRPLKEPAPWPTLAQSVWFLIDMDTGVR